MRLAGCIVRLASRRSQCNWSRLALRRIARTEQLHVAVNITPIMPTANNQVLRAKTRALSAEGAAEIFKLKRDHVKRDTMSTKVRVR